MAAGAVATAIKQVFLVEQTHDCRIQRPVLSGCCRSCGGRALEIHHLKTVHDTLVIVWLVRIVVKVFTVAFWLLLLLVAVLIYKLIELEHAEVALTATS